MASIDVQTVQPTKQAAKPRQAKQSNTKEAALKALLDAVQKAEKAGITVKGVYSHRNDDGTSTNGSLK